MPAQPTAHRTTRRTVVRGGAWSVPVIVVGAAAPAFALSPCAAVPFETGWVAANPASGTLTTGNGTNGYTNGGYATTANQYISIADNNSTGSQTNAGNDATVTLTRNLTLVVGRTYSFDFTISSQFANNNTAQSQIQKLDIQFNSVSIRRYSTRASTTLAAGYTTLATPASGAGSQVVTLTYTPTVTAVTLRYLWTMPGRGTGGTTYAGNGDIAVSAPTIGGC